MAKCTSSSAWRTPTDPHATPRPLLVGGASGMQRPTSGQGEQS